MSSRSRTLKTRTFQKISYFSKSCTFEKLDFQNLVLSKSRTFKTRTFYRIPCLFQNFRVFKNSVFFSKIPRSEKS